MEDVTQYINRPTLAQEELDLENSDDDSTPTGSISSIGGKSVNSVSTIGSFKSALGIQDEAHHGSIGSFKSIGNESFHSFSSTRSYKSAKSHTDTEFGSSLSNANSLASLGTQSFNSCSTYASFKSAKSHTDTENSNDLTPTNSLRSFLGGSVDSFQSFKSARSGTTYTGDDLEDNFGSIGSLESFRSFTTFASFKNARSDLSLSETMTGDNDFASLHRFCTSSSMEKDINECNYLSASDDDEEKDATFLDLGVNDAEKDFPIIETELSQEYDGEICTSKNDIVTLADVTECQNKPECSSIPPHEPVNDFSANNSRFSFSNSKNEAVNDFCGKDSRFSLSSSSSDANTVLEDGIENTKIQIFPEETEHTSLLKKSEVNENNRNASSTGIIVSSSFTENDNHLDTYPPRRASNYKEGEHLKPDEDIPRKNVNKIPRDESSLQPAVKHVPIKILFLVATLVLSQLILRFALFDDDTDHKESQQYSKLVRSNKNVPYHHWWRLVLWRAILQCSLTAIILLSKKFLHCRSCSLHPSTITKTSIYKLGYLLHSLMSFMFVAAMVESSKGLSSQELTMFFFCIPIVNTILDVALERRVPNSIELLTNMLLIASIVMLTHHSTTVHSAKPEVEGSIDEITYSSKPIYGQKTHYQYGSKETNIQRSYPLFIVDLLYGWPIYPSMTGKYSMNDGLSIKNSSITSLENSTEELNQLKSVLHQSKETELDTKVWRVYLSAIVGVFLVSASLQLVIRSSNNNVTKVVFFQGLGVLVYSLAVSSEQNWSDMLFLNENSNRTVLFVLLVAYSGLVTNIIIISLAAKAKNIKIDHMFFKYKAKSHFTDIIMVIVVVQLLLCTMVNTFMPIEKSNCGGYYFNALAITCLSTILVIIATTLSYVHCCCFYRRSI